MISSPLLSPSRYFGVYILQLLLVLIFQTTFYLFFQATLLSAERQTLEPSPDFQLETPAILHDNQAAMENENADQVAMEMDQTDPEVQDAETER